MKNDDHSELQKLLRLKRYEEPRDEYFTDFVREARQRRNAQTTSPSLALVLTHVKEQFSELLKSKWLVSAGMGTAYAGVMAAVLFFVNDGPSISQSNVIPASTELNFASVPIREVNFSRDLSDLSVQNQTKEF